MQAVIQNPLIRQEQVTWLDCSSSYTDDNELLYRVIHKEGVNFICLQLSTP
jgi:hypothetical protein